MIGTASTRAAIRGAIETVHSLGTLSVGGAVDTVLAVFDRFEADEFLVVPERVVGTEFGGTRTVVEFTRHARAEGWSEGFEAAVEWFRINPTPAGNPVDPPTNPYLGEEPF